MLWYSVYQQWVIFRDEMALDFSGTISLRQRSKVLSLSLCICVGEGGLHNKHVIRMWQSITRWHQEMSGWQDHLYMVAEHGSGDLCSKQVPSMHFPCLPLTPLLITSFKNLKTTRKSQLYIVVHFYSLGIGWVGRKWCLLLMRLVCKKQNHLRPD